MRMRAVGSFLRARRPSGLIRSDGYHICRGNKGDFASLRGQRAMADQVNSMPSCEGPHSGTRRGLTDEPVSLRRNAKTRLALVSSRSPRLRRHIVLDVS